MRKLVTIRIDPKVWQTARELGLNISRTCEKCLIAEIQRIQGSNCPTNCATTLIASTQPSRFIEQNELQENPGKPGSPRAK